MPQVLNEWRNLNMVRAMITPAQVARLRCDAAVKWVEHNSVLSVSALPVGAAPFSAAAGSPHRL